MTELEFPVSIKLYIETMEREADWERGDCRPIPQLISDGEMPQPIYSELVRRIEALTPAIWKAWPEECPECGYELEVFTEDTREAWACDGDPVRCSNCGATGHISCSAEEDGYALMYDDQPTKEGDFDV